MPVVKVELPQEAFEQLVTVATRDLRPTAWQAEWMLRKAIQEAVERDHAATGTETPHAAPDGAGVGRSAQHT